MYNLKEFWQIGNLPVPEGEWDGNVICLETNAEWSFGTNKTNGFLSCYTFTIVTRGWLTILYNNRELTLREGDLYTYSPGFEVTVLDSSSDYSGICLLGDEHFTLSPPTVRDAIRTAYFTVVELTSPVLPLKTDDFRRLRELMQMMIHYQQMGLPLANDSLRMLYNLFLTDLSTSSSIVSASTASPSVLRKSSSASSVCYPNTSLSITTSPSMPIVSASPPPTSRALSARCQAAVPSLTTSTRCC